MLKKLILALGLFGLAGCDGLTVGVGTGGYYDSMLWNDYYYGYPRPPDEPDRPERPDPPVRPEHPIAKPPVARPPVARPPVARPPVHRPPVSRPMPARGGRR
ncbi:hypothetical protein [Ruegeria hyattellae]|uniref:hypothetical protein n=1 Tax=Ruegeria hyattellae TaxID=3233337 RepID=UPI00355BC346